MKQTAIIFFLFLTTSVFAQEKQTAATNAFTIAGKVKNEKTITLSALQQYPSIELNDVNISCSPRKEDKVRSVKVVLVKTILDSVAFQYEKPRMLNQYYFLFEASDGYKMVFSFNEIYNTEIGNNLYIVTNLQGTELQVMDNRILILTTKDIKSGTRNMKWLSKIVVCSAE
jgi:Gpi18-like mannosyltransferase